MAALRHAETYPRWLPGTSLRDREAHFVVEEKATVGACGQPVMWAKPGHPATMRPRCADCVRSSIPVPRGR